MKMSKFALSLLIFFILTFTLNSHAQRIMITPEYLKKGDTVGILATARKIDIATLQPAIELLESWGIHVIIGRSIGKEENQLAGPDWIRATDFQVARLLKLKLKQFGLPKAAMVRCGLLTELISHLSKRSQNGLSDSVM